MYEIEDCDLCNGTTEIHHIDCPRLKLRTAEENIKKIRCPICKENNMDVNLDRFYECRSCHRVFAQGTIRRESGYVKIKIYFIHDPEEKVVFFVKENGDGNFPKDKLILDLKLNIAIAEREKAQSP